MSDYHHDREGIPAGWIYLGNDNERYVLGKPGERNILVLGVNPSTAKPGMMTPPSGMYAELRRIRDLTVGL